MDLLFGPNLKSLKAKKDLNGLHTVLEKGSLKNRIEAAKILGEIRDPSSVRSLCVALSTEKYELTEAITNSLAAYGPTILDQLFEIIHELQQRDFSQTSSHIQYAIFKAIVEMGKAAVPSLSIQINHPSRVMRYQVAETLGKIGDPSGVEALVVALKDAAKEVRENARKALGKINDPKAQEIFQREMKLHPEFSNLSTEFARCAVDGWNTRTRCQISRFPNLHTEVSKAFHGKGVSTSDLVKMLDDGFYGECTMCHVRVPGQILTAAATAAMPELQGKTIFLQDDGRISRLLSGQCVTPNCPAREYVFYWYASD